MQEFLTKHRNSRPNILLIGESLLDQYYTVQVNRISPELPIQVSLSEDDEPSVVRPGGIGNCGFQYKHLNANVSIITIIDQQACEQFALHGLNVYYLPDKCKIPRKRRFYADNHALYRWDIEKENFGLSEKTIGIHRQYILDIANNILKDTVYDIVLLSDYGKGIFSFDFSQKIIKICNKHHVPTLVDPKDEPLEKWKNCTYFKPNSLEAKKFSGGISDWNEQAKYLYDKLNCKSVIITHGGKGLVVCEEGNVYKIDSKEIIAQNCIGAGDTFASVMALGIANQVNFKETLQFAYNAGACYVQNRFNKPLTIYEIVKSIDPMQAKFLPLDEIKTYCKANNKKIVWTNGVHDFGNTRGHIECFKFAKQQGDFLIVGINDDESVKQLKGNDRPIMKLDERMHVVASNGYVDAVIDFPEDTPLNIMRKVNPAIVVKGGDYQKEDVVGYGEFEVRLCPLFDGISTTQKIINLKRSENQISVD